MASSRDVLNAFKAHVARLVGEGAIEDARRAWRDFVAEIAPSFPPEHRAEADRLRAEFEVAHGGGTPRESA
jgi:hypothetical protein